MKRFLVLILILTACGPAITPDPSFITAIPSPVASDVVDLCRAARDYETRNWDAAIAALQELREQGESSCDETSITNWLYSMYLAQGAEEEQRGAIDSARRAYRAALALQPDNSAAAERLAALARFRASTPRPTTPACEYDIVLQPYEALRDDFITATGRELLLDDDIYRIYGANYYPRDSYTRFLRDSDSESWAAELDLIAEAGINTLRISLDYSLLFACPDVDATPEPAAFARLETMIAAADQRDLRLILVLHDGVDTATLLDDNGPVANQTRFIVSRYADEASILAWDLRDRGDRDYASASRERVLTWLADTVRSVRREAPRQLITAGWWQRAEDTTLLVDVVSFQHFGEYETLRQIIANLRASTQRPLLLSAIGYSTMTLGETAQRNLLYQAFEEVSSNQMAGWIVYMAFDYPRLVTCIPPDCPGPGREIDHYGMWNTNYFPKMSVEAIERVTGVNP